MRRLKGGLKLIKVVYGQKGEGKTKKLIDRSNKMVSECKGDIVFIGYDDENIYNLRHEIRYINIYDFPVKENKVFMGFICGLISANYDIENIFIDGLNNILITDLKNLKEFFSHLKELSKEYKINFYISISGDYSDIPDFISEFI